MNNEKEIFLNEAIEIVFANCVEKLNEEREFDIAGVLKQEDKLIFEFKQMMLTKEDELFKLMIKRILRERHCGSLSLVGSDYWDGKIFSVSEDVKDNVDSKEIFTEKFLKKLSMEIYKKDYFNALSFKTKTDNKNKNIIEDDNIEEYLEKLKISVSAFYVDNNHKQFEKQIIKDGKFVFENLSMDDIGQIRITYPERLIKFDEYIKSNKIGIYDSFKSIFNMKIGRDEMFFPFVRPITSNTIQKVYLNHYAYHITDDEISNLGRNSIVAIMEKIIDIITMNKIKLSKINSQNEESKHLIDNNNKLLQKTISIINIFGTTSNKDVVISKLSGVFNAIIDRNGEIYCNAKFLNDFGTISKEILGKEEIYDENFSNFIEKSENLDEIQEKEWSSYYIPIKNINNKLGSIKFVKNHMKDILSRNINDYCENFKILGHENSFLILTSEKVDKFLLEDFMVEICNDLYDAENMRPLHIREYLHPRINEFLLNNLLNKVNKDEKKISKAKI